MTARALLFVITCVVFLAQPAFAQEHGVTFLYPVSGLTLNYLDTVNVTWTSNFTSPQLVTFCTNKTDSKDIIYEQTDPVSPYNSSQLVLLKFEDVSLCWFDLRPNSSSGFGANSPSFTLLPVQRSQTTIGLGSPTSLPPISSSSSSLTAAATTATVTAVVTAISSARLGTGAKAGVGVGVAGLVVLLGSLGAFLWWRRRRGASRKAPAASVVENNQKWDGLHHESSVYQRHELYQPPPEVTENAVKHELPATEEREADLKRT